MAEPILQEIVEGAGRLLRAEREQVLGRQSARVARRIVLTLDSGRLWIEPSEEGGELAVRLLHGPGTQDQELVSADEEEPWWAPRGSPLCGAWAVSDAGTGAVGIDLQFRPDDENPKIVTLRLKKSQVHISALPKAQWLDASGH